MLIILRLTDIMSILLQKKVVMMIITNIELFLVRNHLVKLAIIISILRHTLIGFVKDIKI